MPVHYGSSLPPGLESSTKGELRIRVDKLILDEEALQRLSVSPDVENTDGAKRSPNNFVVPVNHCSVAPLFFGEQRPSISVTPATPQENRGSITVVHPIKVDYASFQDYLSAMLQSPHQGILFEVFVPSRYSGRAPVPVGKAIVDLGELAPRRAVSEWFTVGASAFNEESNSSVLVPVGRLKLTFTMVFFSRALARAAAPRGLPKEEVAPKKVVPYMNEPPVTTLGHPEEEEALIGVSSKALPPLEDHLRESPAADASDGLTPSHEHQQQSPSFEVLSTGDSPAQVSGTRGVNAPLRSVEEERPRKEFDHLQTLLQKGKHLEERMAAATQEARVSILSRQDEANCIRTVLGSGHGFHPEPNYLDDVEELAMEDSGLYTSEESDAERFSIQLSKLMDDKHKPSPPFRGSHQPPSDHFFVQAAPPATAHSPVIVPSEIPSSTLPVPPAQPTERTGVQLVAGPTLVAMEFTSISFASTSVTADLEEVRISVCLSKDISTELPAVGPFSSFVHPVPLEAKQICLNFSVSSFSHEKSKLVVQFFKVKSRPILPTGATLLPPHSQLPREVVSETPIGLCIVGLYNQEKDVTLQDPIHNTINALSHLRIRLLPQHGSSTPSRLPASKPGAIATVSPIKGIASPSRESAMRTQSVVLQPSSHAEEPSRSRRHQNDLVGEECPPPLSEEQAVVIGSCESSLENSSSSSTTVEASHGEEVGKLWADAPSLSQIEAPAAIMPPTPHLIQHEGHPGSSSAGMSVNASLYPSSAARAAYAPSVKPSNRCRFHIAVLNAKLLPHVAVMTRNGGDGEDRPLLSALRANIGLRGEEQHPASHSLIAGRHCFKAPNVFFVVEEIFSGVDDKNASTGAVAEWKVDSSTGGHYDRTDVCFGSTNPVYQYESVVSVPQECVHLSHSPLRQKSSDYHYEKRGVEGSTRAEIGNGAPCLRELQLTVWHALDREDAQYRPLKGAAGNEDEFWANAAYVGECHIDLRPLKHLSCLKGYYKITATGQSPFRSPPSLPTLSSTCAGYVQVNVSLLPANS